ncbi:hypothetical protein F3Y22_tig00111298pilonHSYRG00069 [Hibiscus syriacus]|uniref:Uncharacterized protein n=1 Tax=Hibiscus syriacus TaxID=106335 RepID=A0A6A2YS73_HIBSY|nr:hypothetical protein F3Y22_tig00111298pilonHSYRG00069 [Hibiscus syriacus]
MVTKELELCRKEYDVLRERLTQCDRSAELEKKCSIQKSLDIDQLKSDIENAYAESKQIQQTLNSNVENLSLELQHAQEELAIVKRERDDLSAEIQQLVSETHLSDELQNLKNQLHDMLTERNKLKTQIEELQRCLLEVENLRKDSNDVLMEAKVQVEELSSRLSCMEVKMHNDHVNNGKEMAKQRMRLRGTQAQLDAFRYRYKKAVDESDIMNRNFEEASANLKERLASKAIEVLNLKKQLAAVVGGQ